MPRAFPSARFSRAIRHGTSCNALCAYIVSRVMHLWTVNGRAYVRARNRLCVPLFSGNSRTRRLRAGTAGVRISRVGVNTERRVVPVHPSRPPSPQLGGGVFFFSNSLSLYRATNVSIIMNTALLYADAHHACWCSSANQPLSVSRKPIVDSETPPLPPHRSQRSKSLMVFSRRTRQFAFTRPLACSVSYTYELNSPGPYSFCTVSRRNRVNKPKPLYAVGRKTAKPSCISNDIYL